MSIGIYTYMANLLSWWVLQCGYYSCHIRAFPNIK